MQNPFLDKKAFKQLEILVTSPTAPNYNVTGGSAATIDNLDGTFTVYSYDNITRIEFLTEFEFVIEYGTFTKVEVIIGRTLINAFRMLDYFGSMTDFIWNGECNLTNIEEAWSDCVALENINLFDTSKVTNWRAPFYRTTKLKNFPLFDTSAATDMRFCFSKSGIVNVPMFDLSNGPSMGWIFKECQNIRHFPPWDMTNVITMYAFLQQCYNLITVAIINTHNGNQMQDMFTDCTKLHFVAELETIGALNNRTNLFRNNYPLKYPTAAEVIALESAPGADYSHSIINYIVCRSIVGGILTAV